MPPVTLAGLHKEAVMTVATEAPFERQHRRYYVMWSGTDSSGYSECERGHDVYVDVLEYWGNAHRRRSRIPVIISRGRFTFGQFSGNENQK